MTASSNVDTHPRALPRAGAALAAVAAAACVHALVLMPWPAGTASPDLASLRATLTVRLVAPEAAAPALRADPPASPTPETRTAPVPDAFAAATAADHGPAPDAGRLAAAAPATAGPAPVNGLAPASRDVAREDAAGLDIEPLRARLPRQLQGAEQPLQLLLALDEQGRCAAVISGWEGVGEPQREAIRAALAEWRAPTRHEAASRVRVTFWLAPDEDAASTL